MIYFLLLFFFFVTFSKVFLLFTFSLFLNFTFTKLGRRRNNLKKEEGEDDEER